ncbi:MAG TPA: AraC family transcriptional regulator, partial [Clostridia bacterium]|nr:AraC family transcriptional regulator [Clostridia bacterium]
TEGEWLYKEEYESIFKENVLSLSADDCFVICVFKIDNFTEFKLENDIMNRDLIMFAILNIMSEVISQSFPVESVEMYEDQIVSVVGIKAEHEDYIMEISNKIKKSQEYILQYFNISVTAAVSEMVLNHWTIPQGYEYALKSSLYRFAMGKMSIIVPEKIKENISSTKQEYLNKLDKLLVEGIKTSNIKDIKVSLKTILEDISKLDYDRIMVEIVNLIDVVKITFDKMMIDRNCVGSDLTDLENKVFKIETIDEFYHLLFKIIEDKLQYKNEDEIQLKYRDIAKQAVYIIINNYTDSSLCTNQIADMMKMNPRRISRIFKDFSGVTIAEYISEVRLKKAAELLENTQISVYEIIDKIGLVNEYYFYKMFKARYRCTPKEYSLLKAQECREVVITKL